MPTTYEKLVRDRIPEIIRRSGSACRVSVLSPAACEAALRVKLVEEAREVAAAQGADLVTELADLQEVTRALMAAHGITPAEVEACRARRQRERGGFDGRIWLHEVE